MNPNLPITAFRDQIVQTVAEHTVTIITAETGAGKTTQVPQFLMDAGYRVVVTQPRRLAARTAAERVAEESGSPLGQLIGYRVSGESVDSPQTKVLFCTDGLQLVRQLTGRKTCDVLVIDEFHEWNINIETLVAWVKLQQTEGNSLKVVLMSATPEADRLSSYFDGAPVIDVPGKLFPVDEKFRHVDEVVSTIELLVNQGRNILVFVRGLAQIDGLISDLSQKGLQQRAEIIPLHGQLDSAEQKKAFRHYDRPKIVVSTNVAQTSITIDDIDAVVDTGEEMWKEVRSGVEGLYLHNVSQADCTQRKGRAGRTKPGVYFLCSDVSPEERDAYPTAEIQRSRLDQTVLRLAVQGFDALALRFFHDPEDTNPGALKDAHDALVRLGAFDEAGEVTEMGKQINKLPVDVHFARMIIEAKKRKVLPEVLSIVACLQVNGIRNKGDKFLGPQWHKLTSEKKSDLLAELDCFMAALSMNNAELSAVDIHGKRFRQAKEVRARLCDVLKVPNKPVADGNRIEVLKACIAGMVDHLYQYDMSSFKYRGSSNDLRELDNRSVVVGRADWVTAKPFDLNGKDRRGSSYTINLLTFVSAIDPAWLVEVAPHLVTREDSGYAYVPVQNEVMAITNICFNGVKIGEETAAATASPEATRVLAEALAAKMIDYADKGYNSSVINQALDYCAQTHRGVNRPTEYAVSNLFVEKLGDVYQVADLEGVDLKLQISDFVSDEVAEELRVPDAEHIVAQGVTCLVSYERSRLGQLIATVRVPAEGLYDIFDLPVDNVRRIEVVDAAGDVLVRSFSMNAAQREYQDYLNRKRKQDEKQGFLDDIVRLQAQQNQLETEGKPTDTLRELISAARTAVDRLHSYYRAAQPGDVVGAIRKAEREIERLSGDVSELLLEDLVTGRLTHRDVKVNQQFMEHLEVLALRSGRFIEPITPEQLRKHYEQKLGGVTDANHIYLLDLGLNPEDYAPADVIAELDLAPEEVELEGRKGMTSYSVTYGFVQAGDERIGVGIVKVPVSIYERNCGRVGRNSKFPELPYGIELIIEVTEGDKTIAQGHDDEELARKVKKNKGKTGDRAGDRDRQIRLASLGISSEGPTAPPPWFKGRLR